MTILKTLEEEELWKQVVLALLRRDQNAKSISDAENGADCIIAAFRKRHA